MQGSRTDADLPAADVDAAARRLYAELLQALPPARIVVIGPVWPSGDPPEAVTQTRDTVRDAATAAQLPFLDPIADGWFDGPDPDAPDPDADQGFVGADGRHLTDEGHRRLADRVGEGLRRVGAVPR